MSQNPPTAPCCEVDAAKAGESRAEVCSCATPEEGSRTRTVVGWAIIAMACGLSWLAYTTSALLWPVVFIIAWFGAYQTVYARGCRIGVGEADKAGPSAADPGELLDTRARRTRSRMGAGFLLIGTLVAALAAWRWFWLWPLAFVVGWFGASFLVAAATRYPGCPEVGAIPSLVLRRRVVTRCPPMERLDHTVESRS